MRSSWLNKEKSQEDKFRGDTGAALTIFFIVPIILVFWPGGIYSAVYKKNWLQTNGTIVSSRWVGHKHKNFVFDYKYRVGNEDHQGKGGLSLGMVWKMQKYNSGVSINVYYNPIRPGESSLRKTINPYVFWPSLLLIAIAVYEIIRKKRKGFNLIGILGVIFLIALIISHLPL